MNGKMDRKPNRKKYYDYSSSGYYFITICIKNKLFGFGEISENKMILDECGQITKKCWLEIPNHFPNAKTDEFIIMPNHFHGILIIENPIVGNGHARSNENFKTFVVNRHACSQTKQEQKRERNKNKNRHAIVVRNRHAIIVRNRHACSLRQHQQLPVIIGSFKSAVTKLIHRKYDKNFQWQKSYYDHIIRDESSLNKIRDYIRQNPQN